MGELTILRIIAGTAKGHKIKTPKGIFLRPTSDRVKESLFNILSGMIAGADVLDLYAGTGNLGIEALSRGAGSAVFVDREPANCSLIRENLIHTKLMGNARIIRSDALKAIEKLSGERLKFDIIFLDPPYNKKIIEKALKYIENNDIIKKSGVIAAERDIDEEVPEKTSVLKLVRNERYGDTVLSFYRPL